MIAFREAHGTAGFGFFERTAVGGEEFAYDFHGGAGAIVDGGAGPIENDGADHRLSSSIICSPKAKESVMPLPPVTLAMRTPGSGSMVRKCLVGWLA